MAKKTKQKWQIEVRRKLDQSGMGYRELAQKAGLNEGTVRQVMSKDSAPGVKRKICEFLGINESEVK